ncbi:TIGR03757 family integrating conjugative element protein [Carnimonas bestiolae]|uniref:TIGR03757 family integrating conjugative element protein n=1 Tax=Carnimonas bestiolae TaxID=3402172 RepID=UPI003EDC2E7C
MKRRWQVVAGIVFLPLWVTSANAGVEVFTLSTITLQHVPHEAAVVEMDRGEALDREISEGLPNDSDAASRVMATRMKTPAFQEHAEALKEAYTGLTRAWQLGIQKLPAVVVDQQYVVYGESDVRRALAEIHRHKENP